MTPRLLSQKDAAAYLGVSLSTFREHVRPDLPIERAKDGSRVYPTHDLDAWVESRKVQPQPDEPDEFAPKVGWVYCVEAVGCGRAKLGWTLESVASRMKQLGHACPFPLRLAGKTRGTIRSEREAHKRFAHLRVAPKSEWFMFEKELQAFARRMR